MTFEEGFESEKKETYQTGLEGALYGWEKAVIGDSRKVKFGILVECRGAHKEPRTTALVRIKGWGTKKARAGFFCLKNHTVEPQVQAKVSAEQVN